MRKIYSLVLIAVGLLISTNVGAVNTLTVGTSGADYTTIAAALGQASDGDMIQLLTDINEAVTINKAITLDLNSKTLSSCDHEAVLTLNATEILVKNGTVETYSQNLQNNDEVKATGIVIGGGHAKLYRITVTAQTDMPYYGVDVRENASLDIENGNYKGYYALKLSQSNNESGQMAYRVGNIHIYGTAEFYTEHYCTINTASDAYVVISGNDTKWTSPSWFLVNAGRLLIEGGTFESTEYSDEDDNTPVYSYGALWITGGTFIAPDGNERSVYGMASEYIYGGYFTTTFNRQSSKIPLEGYQYREVEIGGRTLYEAVPSLAKSEQTSETFGSIQEAINAAVDNDKIMLITPTTDKGKNIPYWDGEYKTRPFGNTISEDFTVDNKTIRLGNNGRDYIGKITATNSATVYIYGSNSGVHTITFDKDETSTIKVVSGIYSSKPDNEYLLEGALVTEQGEGENKTYKVESYVAKTGEGENDKHLTLKAAIEAANSMDNATITLLMNADDSETGSDGLKIQKPMTIDLNGNTIYQMDNHSASRGTFWIKSAGDITIKNGTLVGKDNNTNGIEYESQGGNLCLQNLTINRTKGAAVDIMLSSNFTCALHLDANCHLNGVGSIKTSDHSLGTSTFVINNAAQLGEVNINNYTGSINNTGALTLTGNTTDAKTLTIKNEGTIIINKGTFGNAFTFEDNKVGTITINGGYFTDAVKTLLEGKVTLGADKQWNKTLVGDVEYWTVMSDDELQCYIGEDQEHKYTLLDAINKVAKDGTATITLCNDVNAENTQYVIKDNKDITIDLNGYTINGIRNDGKGNEFFSIQYGSSSLTIDDNSNDKNGRIVYELTNSTSSTAYMIYLLNGTFTLNNGILENKSQISMPVALALDRCSSAEINGGQLIYEGDRGYVCRLRPFNDTKEDNPLTFTLNGGEIKGMWPIWINVENNSKPYVHVSVNGGKILSTIQEEAIYSSSLGANGTFENVKIDITAGEIDGLVALGGGMDESRKVIETVDLAGGLYSLHRALRPQKRSAETHVQYISGGAYYFDYGTNSSDTHLFTEFCEYIKPGHYALKMHMVDGPEADFSMEVNGNNYYFDEGEAADGSFWAVIDGKGKVEPVIIETEDSETKELTWKDDINSDERTDVMIAGNDGDETSTKVTVTDVVEGIDAKANRLILEKGAGIIVETGATLDVGMGGVQITGDENKKGTTFIWVKPGGTFVSNGTVVSSTEKDVVVFADETGAGTFLISPDVNYNNTPHATVQMHTEVGYDSDCDEYYWHRFAMPVDGIEIWNKIDDYGTEMQASTYLYGWDYDQDDWLKLPNGVKDMTPFNGYTLTHTLPDPTKVNYIFEGDLLGNVPSKLNFEYEGYNFFGNSYTGYIDAKTLLDEIMHVDNKNVKGSIWMWKSEEQSYSAASLTELSDPESGLEVWQREVAPMHTFILCLNQSNQSLVNINYASAIWGNPRYSALIEQANQEVSVPQRKGANYTDRLNLLLTAANGQKDQVRFTKGEDYSDAYEDGADAPKYMNKGCLNVYSTVDGEDYTSVYSDELEGKTISFQSLNDIEYTFTFTKVQGNYSLVDTETGITTPLIEGGEYSFVAQPNTVITDRFVIMAAKNTPTDLIQTRQGNAPKGIFTMFGQYVGKTSAWHMLPKGVYVVDGVKLVK